MWAKLTVKNEWVGVQISVQADEWGSVFSRCASDSTFVLPYSNSKTFAAASALIDFSNVKTCPSLTVN